MIQLSQQDLDDFCSQIDLPEDWEENPAGECWIWKGSLANRNSKTPMVFLNGITYMSRRVSFELYYQKEPSKRLENTCGNKLCINPYHMIESHGLWNTKVYTMFDSLITRIFNSKQEGYLNYGKRGIDCDPRYDPKFNNQGKNVAFQNFLNDLIELGMYPIPEGVSIDRIDNNRGYWRDNIRLSTPAEQCQNRRSTKLNKQLVRDIRSEFSTGKFTKTDLAISYGTTKENIDHIVNNRTWKNA